MNIFRLDVLLLHELVQDLEPLAWAGSMATSVVAASRPAAASFLGLGLLRLGLVLVENGHHDYGILTGIADLEEGMWVVNSLLAHATEVEVFADAALVADTLDRRLLAPVAKNVGMLHIHVNNGSGISSSCRVRVDHHRLILEVFEVGIGRIIRLLYDKVLIAHELVEGRLGLVLKLPLNEVLNRLARNALLSLLLCILLLSGHIELLLLNHIDVLLDLLEGRCLLRCSLLWLFCNKLDALVVAEGKGVGHLKVRIVFDDDCFAVQVDVLDSHRLFQAFGLGKGADLGVEGHEGQGRLHSLGYVVGQLDLNI